ncbi:restriction endonuclease [Ralstonia pseudosolanacearum]|uniref:restriction endonuclease n=2 Tax=Ralstonia pseudosolanacearum TaxID=1310165 RepID=UPI003CEFB2EA
MSKMWMIRADGGTLYEEFRERGIAAIGWTQLAPHAKVGMTRKELIDLYLSIEPGTKEKTAISGASQVWRFMNEIKVDDWVVTYSPANRTYLIGKVTGNCEYRPDLMDLEMPLARTVKWQDKQVERDSLSDASKTSLGSTLTVFVVAAFAMQELLGEATGKPMQPAAEVLDEQVDADPLSGMAALALERIKDLVRDGVQNSFRRTESSKRSGCVTDDAKPDANGTLRAAWRGRFPPARGGVPSCAGLTHQSSAHHP